MKINRHMIRILLLLAVPVAGCVDRVLPAEPYGPGRIVFNELEAPDSLVIRLSHVNSEEGEPSVGALADGFLSSPPGGRLVVISDSLGSHIIVYDAAWGMVVHRFETEMPGTIDEYSVAIAPDGSRVAYHVDLLDDQGVVQGRETRIVSLDGSDSVVIRVDDPPVPHSYIRFSPDGRYIAFVGSALGSGVGQFGLYIASVDGRDVRKLYEYYLVGTGENTLMDWSPDASQIVFVVGEGTLHTIRTDGTELTNLNVKGTYPDWSPDGAVIVCTGGGNSMVVASAYGSGMLSSYDRVGLHPQWSPDGRRILFAQPDYAVDGTSSTTRPGYQLVVIDAASGLEVYARLRGILVSYSFGYWYDV